MSERMTSIRIPGVFGSGYADYGRKTPKEMIDIIRDYALTKKAEAEIILNAKDEDFRVETHLGHFVRNKIEVLQEGKTKV